MKPLVSVIILSYDSARFIRRCLDSVFTQTYPQLEVLVIINGSSDGSAEIIRSYSARRKNLRVIEPGENLWYSRGNNLGISETGGEYILALNQDTILTPDFIAALSDTLSADLALGSVTGKLLHYDFEIDSRTKILDSTGIEMFKTRRVIDRGQWERDRSQYDLDTDVFGASGAAAMYRRSALEQAKIPKKGGGFEYFDEDFTAYKEDVDLSWRLRLFGWPCRYVPEAVVHHGRMIGRSWPTQFIRFVLNRHRQSRTIRRLSFKNHYLMMVKNELPRLFWRNIFYILAREVLLLLYTALFEQFQVAALYQFFRQLPEARRKRRYIMRRIKVFPSGIRPLFH